MLKISYNDGNTNIAKAIYPPQTCFLLPNNIGITFSAFQKFIDHKIDQVSIAEINDLIFQNNYLSLFVKDLGEQY